MVLSKLGSAGSAAIAAISASWAANARSKAGRKCADAMRPKGGTPKEPVQSSKKGLSLTVGAAADVCGWVMRDIWCCNCGDATHNPEVVARMKRSEIAERRSRIGLRSMRATD